MIKISKTYHLALTEDQAKELYKLLLSAKHTEHITHDNELVLVYHELKKLFDSGIRSTENKDYNHLYAPGTK